MLIVKDRNRGSHILNASAALNRKKIPSREHRMRVTDLQAESAIALDNSPGDMASPGELLARHWRNVVNSDIRHSAKSRCR